MIRTVVQSLTQDSKAAEDCPHSKTRALAVNRSYTRRVLECGSPLPLFFAQSDSLPHFPHALSTLIFSGSHWLSFAAAVLLVALSLLCWSYRATPRGGDGHVPAENGGRPASNDPLPWLCFALKALAFAALAVCLLEPLWSGQRARPGANLFSIVADNSQSLQVKDHGANRSRGDSLLDLLNPQRAGWQGTLEENFDVRRYYFDARLQSTRDFSELAFDGRASAIGASLRALAERYHGRPLAGILLFTDGNATDLPGPAALAGLPPVYPVLLGNPGQFRDIAIRQVRTTQTDFEDAPVSIQADISAAGCRGESIVARLLDVSGKQVMEQTLKARNENDLLAFRFQLRPEKHGLSFYRVSVRAKNEAVTPDQPQKTEEATLANNTSVVVVDRGHGPYRILYVTGRPTWEFKFLNRAVQEDDQLQLVGLIRIAKREPKFTFMGRPGETSNPLFRGFGNQAVEDVERYDQPVVVRLNTRDEFELRAGFPTTPEDLYAYHAVIVDHLEAEFFTPDQAALLQRFVSERGGGFLMLGGMESFQQGRYQRTPIGDMLPVYLDPAEETNPPGPLRLELTREGWLQPWARLRDNEADEKARLQGMAPFQVLNRVREVKPGASIIATVADADGKSLPALVVQRFGRGRTAALTLGDVWRWGFHDTDAHHDMDKAWRQLMRWLVNDVPNRVDLLADPEADSPNGAVKLQVRVRDPKFQPLDNAGISLTVQPVMTEPGPGGETNVIRLPAEASATEPGLYEAAYVPRATGGYQASVCVTNSDGVEVGRAAGGWSTDLAAEEFRSLAPNIALLETIARATGGELVSADKLDQFARNLPHRHAPVMESWTWPLWHTPAMFGFALACLAAEWGLRRWKGLP
ncbi:MAG TPA: glutamine amidotransferase [Candidatus Acidoferrum sp.]|nr:glutamine amidotransferase [Candidatus Acidoferrum sp.]